MLDQGWPTGFQLGLYQVTDLALVMANILSLLPINPLSFSQYGRELHLVSNLTVGCRCRKENSWDGSRQTQIRPLSENCGNRDSLEKTMVSRNSRGLLIISDPHCFLHSMLKGQKSGFFRAAPPRYPMSM